MEPFHVLTSQAVLLLRDNLDTDQIIPSRYAILPDKAEMAEGLFANWRQEDPGCPLNDPRMRGRRILLAGGNFGCGSSREGAVWALLGQGFRAVVGHSFGDIFRINALKNGLLLVELAQRNHQELVALLTRLPDSEVTIDLPALMLTVAQWSAGFSMDRFAHELLVRGQDELDYLLGLTDSIRAYETSRIPSPGRPTSPGGCAHGGSR